MLMEQRGFGFVTYADPAHAQAFLEVRTSHLAVAGASQNTLLLTRHQLLLKRSVSQAPYV